MGGFGLKVMGDTRGVDGNGNSKQEYSHTDCTESTEWQVANALAASGVSANGQELTADGSQLTAHRSPLIAHRSLTK